MRTLLAWSVVAAASIAGTGCGETDPAPDRAATAAPAPRIPSVTVDDLDRLLAAHDARAVDANADTTRRRMGVIPGAVLLPDPDSLAGLPADKAAHLVFYCSNDACRSSHDAAARALTAGYTRVEVMPAGIAGWVKAGKRTQAL
jgi:rhodanese-related sulfurtransferase